jgi:multiple sugar transport system permease protein
MKININKKEKYFIFILLLPWLLNLIVFWVYPLLYSIVLSFSDYSTLTNEIKFTGFKNYIKIFSDKAFYNSMINTLIFVVGTVPLTTAISMLLAVLLNSKSVKFKEFYKAAYFIPSVTSMVVVSILFSNLYSQAGYLNKICQMLSIPFPAKGFLQEPSTALFSIMAMDIWMAVGYYMVIFLAGLQAIPNDLYESAELNGASFFQKLFKITIPLLKNTFIFVIIINTIKSFQVFIEIFIMTKGGPLNSTNSLVYLVFQNAFEKTDMMGYASALGIIVFIIILIFSLVQMKLMKVK